MCEDYNESNPVSSLICSIDVTCILNMFFGLVVNISVVDMKGKLNINLDIKAYTNNH